MKRDDDLIRSLLIEIEESDSSLICAPVYLCMPAEDEQRNYHLELLSDGGLVKEISKGVYRLTNDGHDYIDVIRSNKIWEKTKSGAAQIGGVTLGMMRDIAASYVKQEAAEKLGIKL